MPRRLVFAILGSAALVAGAVATPAVLARPAELEPPAALVPAAAAQDLQNAAQALDGGTNITKRAMAAADARAAAEALGQPEKAVELGAAAPPPAETAPAAAGPLAAPEQQQEQLLQPEVTPEPAQVTPEPAPQPQAQGPGGNGGGAERPSRGRPLGHQPIDDPGQRHLVPMSRTLDQDPAAREAYERLHAALIRAGGKDGDEVDLPRFPNGADLTASPLRRYRQEGWDSFDFERAALRARAAELGLNERQVATVERAALRKVQLDPDQAYIDARVEALQEVTEAVYERSATTCDTAFDPPSCHAEDEAMRSARASALRRGVRPAAIDRVEATAREMHQVHLRYYDDRRGVGPGQLRALWQDTHGTTIKDLFDVAKAANDLAIEEGVRPASGATRRAATWPLRELIGDDAARQVEEQTAMTVAVACATVELATGFQAC